MINTIRYYMNLVEADASDGSQGNDRAAIADQIAQRDAEEDDAPTFEVMSDKPQNRDKTRPLAVVIHPGDMIETDEEPYEDGDEDHGDEDEDEDYSDDERMSPRSYSRENQYETAREIEYLHNKGCDVVVLHRGSCSQFHSGPGIDELAEAIEIIWDHHTVLFGDNLAAASKWIIEHCDVADRPMIYMLGAYADFDSGCLTKVGKALMQIVGPERIKVSDWSPCSAYPGDPVWRPSRTDPVPHREVRYYGDKDSIR